MYGMFSEFNALAKQIHENARDHGWWEDERTLPQLCALFHDELSEAHEEYRNGNENEYEVNGKPEGIAPELADYIIRLLDYAGNKGIDIDMQFKRAETWTAAFVNEDFSQFIADCHKDISTMYDMSAFRFEGYEAEERLMIARCIVRPMVWMILNKIDPIAVIKRKHAYNKTRPYRHGGKVC